MNGFMETTFTAPSFWKQVMDITIKILLRKTSPSAKIHWLPSVSRVHST